MRVRGGRVGDNVTIVEEEPVFNLGEEVVVFLYQPDWMSLIPVPQGVEASSYYLIKGYMDGKYQYKDGAAIRINGDTIPISDLQEKIKDIHKNG